MKSLDKLRKRAIFLRGERGFTLNSICRDLQVAKGTAYYWIKDIPLPTKPRKYKTQIDWLDVQQYYDGHSWRETKEKFGYHSSSWCNAIKRGYITPRPKAKPLAEYLIEKSHSRSRVHLKHRLIKARLLRDECAICGIHEWCGKKLVLELDHINGIGNDNRLENLRLLCPNCHSQTDTFAGKNVKRAIQSE